MNDKTPKAEVTEIPLCGCTGTMLERMAAQCFAGPPHRVPNAFKCPCGIVHPLKLNQEA